MRFAVELALVVANARTLSAEERDALEAGLNFAARLAECDPPLSLDQVQQIYNAFLEENVDDADAIIALGLAFGQCIVSSGPFEWVRVSDEYGEETSIAVLGAAIYLHPVSMIQRRLEQRERIIVEQLCNDTLAHLGELVEKGEHALR